MGRSGVRWDEIACVRDALDTPAFEGCYTQFHSADRDDGSIDVQTERFRQAVAQLKRRPALLHVANSAGALRDRRYAFDLVRPGVFLYGGSPGAGLPEPRPVVSVRARVVSVRHVRAGESVSYGALWTAPRQTTVATLGIGYADGLRRSLGVSGRGAVLLRGRRCPIIGAVTMDLCMVEVEELRVQVGDVDRLEFPDDYFDAVVGQSVLHHLNLDHALPELRRVLSQRADVPRAVGASAREVRRRAALPSASGCAPEVSYSEIMERRLRAASWRSLIVETA